MRPVIRALRFVRYLRSIVVWLVFGRPITDCTGGGWGGSTGESLFGELNVEDVESGLGAPFRFCLFEAAATIGRGRRGMGSFA